jgi:SAM-dependent methyltransferase
LLHHVFEHLHDPVAALRNLAGSLTPGGRIVLVYPNPGALARCVYGVAWRGWDCPRHLVLPPPSALHHAARRAGLRVVATRTTARNAASMFGHSRRGQELGSIDLADETSVASDHLMARVERFAVALGAPWGEEAIVTLGVGSAS